MVSPRAREGDCIGEDDSVSRRGYGEARTGGTPTLREHSNAV